MRALKVLMVVLIALAFIVPLTVNESQAAGWYSCYVNQVGNSPGATWVQISDSNASPSFTDTWFQFDPSSVQSCLATALTALASGMKVNAYLEGTTGGTITAFYLASQ
jgi:hypothetical protein